MVNTPLKSSITNDRAQITGVSGDESKLRSMRVTTRQVLSNGGA